MQHSKLGASSAYRWTACPGSVALCEQAPEQESSIYAQEGTEAHEWAEKLCLGEIKLEDAPEEIREHIKLYWETTLAVKGQRFIEKQFSLEWLHTDMFGTNDACVYDEKAKTLHVFDYKHGAGVAVEVENNLQLQYYALGALKELQDEGHEIDIIRMVIVQPRASHPDGPVREWTITKPELIEFAKWLRKKAQETEAKDAPLSAGDHCRWCSAAGICPELRKSTMDKLITVLDEVDDSEGLSLAEPNTLSNEELGDILNNIDMISGWIKAVEKEAYIRANNGQAIPGRKLVERIGNRKWVDDAEGNVITLAQKNDVNPYEPQKLKSPAQLEKLLPKEAAKELANYIERPITGVMLVHESDKRDAIDTNLKNLLT